MKRLSERKNATASIGSVLQELGLVSHAAKIFSETGGTTGSEMRERESNSTLAAGPTSASAPRGE